MKKLLLCLSLVLNCLVIFGQDGKRFVEGKLYLQTDRSSYFAGDTVFAKAFFTSYPSGKPLPFQVLHIDLIDLSEPRQLLFQKFYASKNTSTASVILPDNLSTGRYLLRAYTFAADGVPTIFDRFVNIHNRFSNNQEILEYEKELRFFPESGRLIAGDSNIVAFRYSDKIGNPFDVSGKVFNRNGKEMATIKNSHDGMGMFSFVPEKSAQYYVLLDNDKKKYPLSKVDNDGILTHFEHTNNSIQYAIKSLSKINTNLNIVAQIGNRILFSKSIAPNERGTIPTSDFPSGVLLVTILDKDSTPLSERLFFINNKEYVQSTIFTKALASSQPQTENLYSLDMEGVGFGSYAVSVSDASFEKKMPEQNLLSAFLLTSYLQNPVFDPAQYFNEGIDNTSVLDLVTWTNQYKQTQKLDSSTRKNEGSISGTISYKASSKKYASKPVSLVTLSEDDSTTKSTIFNTDNMGRFVTEPLSFIGKNRLTFSPIPVNKWDFIIAQLDAPTELKTLLDLPKPIKARKSKIDVGTTLYDSVASIKGALERVMVRSNREQKLKQLEARYATGRFKELTGQVYDMRDATNPYMNIFEYMQYGYPDIDTRSGVLVRDMTGTFRMCEIYLDEVLAVNPCLPNDNTGLLNHLRPSDLSMVKIVYNYNFASCGYNIRMIPALAIYTRKGKDFTGSDEKYDVKYYTGFTRPETFSAPKTSFQRTDARVLLDWNPKASTSKRVGFVPVHFFNNDSGKSFAVHVEGLTDEGKFVSFYKRIE